MRPEKKINFFFKKKGFNKKIPLFTFWVKVVSPAITNLTLIVRNYFSDFHERAAFFLCFKLCHLIQNSLITLQTKISSLFYTFHELSWFLIFQFFLDSFIDPLFYFLYGFFFIEQKCILRRFFFNYFPR
ncbi:hypothetical protein GLOIN_2v1662622 [Rhizophagus irregularis DAOM 181602=DAOM 197198]|uniref:Uncharacterized protein n=1 Tax=Rhizophagus irregularis (strain DAOM 181602 / DAOM 197198 / MUCL 43194) TaxID=747089 RepID=A0A2P4PK64_RHIID|nr:hypothetical protein GLOIN_2v1662622 [Rhizophagus irregularis DAOM 181602=DAOM 197198]POG65802.1 hypothetical protein GLOIN_2v1662622 [Rhizophagus irregularis DAOM 181602=DAOM 197198]GET63882.1 hypothetical protein GLOIN_2v1662622 [Rhizophagus irregularis DAOM 181602=DAOM 197198]|eukprot:XP_025172668.1 hypothetical protein GLOIN_2v1662622 [Rhizophagus irregularis DAOM 181602=DAOM 197198]